MGLPAGYKWLEYIESTGTQYIDTGLANATGYTIQTKMNFASLGSPKRSDLCYICGSLGAAAIRSYVLIFQKKLSLGVVSDAFGEVISVGTDYQIEASMVSGNGYLIVDGHKTVESNKTYNLAPYNLNLMLFGIDDGGSTYSQYRCSAKMYYFKIYDNDVLVRDYIPCVNNSGEVGLYDFVGGKFYGDVAGGSFKAGPVVAIRSLVDYRTSADVERVKTLQSRIESGKATDDEIAEWLNGLIGAYNAEDMNRVESAVDYLQTYLNGVQAALDAYRAERKVASDAFWIVPWNAFSLVTKKDWVLEDIPSESDLARYLSNVDAVTNAIAIAKKLPATMNLLDYIGANEIERALRAEYDEGMAYENNTKRLIDNTQAAFVYSGEFYGGEF